MSELLDVVDRVRKLLALATSPNVHEAAAAAARAQALISRHHLASLLGDTPDPDPVTDGADAPLERARKLRKWRVVLASSLAEVNGCVAYSVDLGAHQELRVAGRSADRTAVAALWEWLPERIQWLSASLGAGRSRQWHDDFRIGAVEAVVEQLRQAVHTAHDALSPAALVVVDPALSPRAGSGPVRRGDVAASARPGAAGRPTCVLAGPGGRGGTVAPVICPSSSARERSPVGRWAVSPAGRVPRRSRASRRSSGLTAT
jgi:hypothetical protein